MRRYVLAWIPMLFIAVANGAVRETTYGRTMPELRAHQFSTLTGVISIGVFIWVVVRVWPPETGAQAARIGLVWVALTVAFEFFMTIVLQGRPPRSALAAYDLLAGQVWVLFLAWLAVAPWLFFRLRSPR